MTYTSDEVSLEASGEWTFTDWKRPLSSVMRVSNMSPMKTFMTSFPSFFRMRSQTSTAYMQRLIERAWSME